MHRTGARRDGSKLGLAGTVQTHDLTIKDCGLATKFSGEAFRKGWKRLELIRVARN